MAKARRTKPKHVYVARSGINSQEGDRYEPGDDVPAAVIKRSPWLVEQGHVQRQALPERSES